MFSKSRSRRPRRRGFAGSDVSRGTPGTRATKADALSSLSYGRVAEHIARCALELVRLARAGATAQDMAARAMELARGT